MSNNKKNTELLVVARELVTMLDKAADATLPEQIVDVVKLHSKLAVGSAWIPIPGADVAAGAANIWTMYARINGKIDIPFKENVLKSIGAGVAANLTGYLAMSTVTSLLKFIPGVGTIGGALILSASLYALTLVSGWVYLKALCIMVSHKGTKLTGDDLKKAIDIVLADKKVIKDLMDTATREYKSQNKK